MVGCYIIFSDKLNRFYIGATQDEVSLRIQNHNLGKYGKHRFTSTADDWKLFLFITSKDYSHAIRLERKIKSMRSRKYFHDLVKYPNLLEKLVSNT